MYPSSKPQTSRGHRRPDPLTPLRSLHNWALATGWSGRRVSHPNATGILIAALGMLDGIERARGAQQRPFVGTRAIAAQRVLQVRLQLGKRPLDVTPEVVGQHLAHPGLAVSKR